MAEAKHAGNENDVPEAIRALVAQYLVKRRVDVQRIYNCLNLGKLKEVASIGHNMKGTGVGFGLPDATKIGLNLEMAAKSGDVSAIRQETAALCELLGRVEPEFIGARTD